MRNESEQRAYRKLDKDILSLFRNLLLKNLFNPKMLFFLFTAFFCQRKGAKQRLFLEKKGLHVPAFMIVSVTSACNLHCKGCYSSALRPVNGGAMSAENFRKLLSEARELGVGIILISGGEPLSCHGILETMKDFPEIIFVLFTNGLLIDQKTIQTLGKYRHIVPVLSLEGDEKETDERRGEGVFRRVIAIPGELKKAGILSGISLTFTKENFDTIFSNRYMQEMLAKGSNLVFLVEYVPAEENTQNLEPSIEQRKRLPAILKEFRSRFPALFFVFPFEEEDYGGCLASGRGFIHINSQGDVEPCPFAPYSDTNIWEVSLKRALSSRILDTIRRNHGKLAETSGGCALWKNREWLQTLVKK